MKYDINERAWQEIYKFLKTISKIHVKNEYKTRLFIEAIYHLALTGSQIRKLHKEYGCCFSIHQRFMRWVRIGVFQKMIEFFQDQDAEYFMIDATIIRANQCSSGYRKNSQEEQALGRSCGGFSTKIHALVDALGNPVDFILTPGNNHDVTEAENLTKNLENTALIADKGYDSQDFIDSLKENNCEAIIPSKSNSKNPRVIDYDIYKERNLIERFFNKIKWFRRIFSRFDKTAISYISHLQFVSSLILLK